jgi:CheY-like chemotaxis protein/signal transduction histidine kinase
MLDKLSIKARLIASFGIVLVIFILYGYSAMHEMERLGVLTATLHRHPLTVSNAALRASMGVVKMHRSMKDLTLAQSEREQHDAIVEVREEEQLVYRQLEIINQRILGKEGKDLLIQTREMFANWKPIRDEVMDLAQQGKSSKAAQITRGKGAAYVAQLERQMLELTSYARNKADGFMADAELVQDKLQVNAVVFAAGIFIFLVLLALALINSILSSLTSLKKTMQQITSSGELAKAEITGKNEISQMAVHFNGLVRRLEDQFWLRDGLNQFNSQLSQDQSYQELLDKAISFLAHYVDACKGALFIWDQNAQRCQLRATYAYVKRQHLSNRFALGEGIVGQVALEKAPILLSNLADDSMRAQSGTGSRPVRCIYAVPLLYEDEFLGVVELAWLQDIPGPAKELIDAAVQILATALYASEQAEHIKELYQSAQATNTEMERKQLALDASNEQLAATNEELQAQAEELQAQAAEMMAQTEELERQRSQVEEADRLKSEFLSNMSHELRTPLNSVLALSQLMISQGTGKDQQKEMEFLRVIQRNGRHLLNLINDILDLSKVESGKLELYPTAVDTKILISNVLDTVRPLAREKELELKVRADEAPSLQGDQGRLEQILLNLLTNAVKFTESGQVELTTRVEGDEIVFKVSDTGIGIDPNELPRIFDQFRQADGSTTRRYEGTGLGLAICQKLAQAMGGSIGADSEPGKGSCFELRLPLKQPDAPPSQPKPARPSPAQRIARAHSQGRRVLVIDDDSKVRNLVRQYLQDLGYQVMVAENGQQGLEMARNMEPWAITLDVLMPEMDGWELLRRLKDSPQTSSIPVVVISVTDDHTTAKTLGADGYVVKPIDRAQLLRELEQISATRRAQRILAVDDDPTVLIYLENFLGERGYEVETASGGEEALAKLAADAPDVLILDLMMPGLDGFTVLEKMRQDPALEELPAIVLTAKDLSAGEQAHLEQAARRTVIKGSMDIKRLLGEVAEALRQIAERQSPPVHGKKTLLVVEDNEVASMQIKSVLEQNGYGIVLAKDGSEGLRQVDRLAPDGIIMDLMMPEVDGFELLERIRSSPATREIPVLILTAKELTRQDRERLSRNNVHELIQKGNLDQEGLLRLVRGFWEPISANEKTEQSPGGKNGGILLVEDNPDNLLAISAILEMHGFRFQVARDGRAAVEQARSLQPGLILMDIQLPVMSGLQAIEQIKSGPATSSIPIIALTARAMKGDREQIMKSGCEDYLGKPIDPAALIKKIKQWLKPDAGR